MKKVLAIIVLSLSTANGFAAEILDAKIITKKDGSLAIAAEVSYGGGCEEHSFTLKVGTCYESMPVQCESTLIDSGAHDACEAMISETIELPLKENGLLDSYFSEASITIQGDNSTSVEVKLPTL